MRVRTVRPLVQRGRTGARAALALATLSSLALGACRDSRQDVTALVVRVESDLTVGTEIDEIAVNKLDRSLSSAADVPWTVAFTPSGSSSVAVEVTATARLAHQDVVSQSFTTSFLPGQVGLLVIHLDRGCLPSRVTCAAGLTCEAGVCVSKMRPPSPYPGADAGTDASGGSDARDGAPSADGGATDKPSDGAMDGTGATDSPSDSATGATDAADAASPATCGNGVLDPGEMCEYCLPVDGGPAPPADAGAGPCKLGITESKTCNGDCTLSRCGDGKLNRAAGESCDTSGESATCNSDCTLSRCGDGKLNAAAGETCELPNGGATDITTCNGPNAPAGVACHAATCGDGYVNPAAGETCDTSGGANTAACNGSAAPSGVRCRATRCGDGYVNAAATEACDDGNSSACGTCNATCNVLQSPTFASGSITAATAMVLTSGETFTIADGLHSPITFEFTTGVPAAGHVGVSTATPATAAVMATRIAAAINATGVSRASVDTTTPTRVILIDGIPGAAGNIPIAETVASTAFVVIGMSGGSAYDCGVGVGCTANTDCASAICTRNICAAASCGDGVMNGWETGIDCGGGTCSPCASTRGCFVNADCASGVCNASTCQ
jgi:cysteine-rich repeat protein